MSEATRRKSRTKSILVPTIYLRGTVTVTNLSPASRGHPSSRTLKSRLRYKLDHRVVGEVFRLYKIAPTM